MFIYIKQAINILVLILNTIPQSKEQDSLETQLILGLGQRIQEDTGVCCSARKEARLRRENKGMTPRGQSWNNLSHKTSNYNI